MKSGPRKAIAALAVLAAAVYFVATAEEEGGVSIWDWLRDPEGSRERHAAHLAGEDTRVAGRSAGEVVLQSGPLPFLAGRVLRVDGSTVGGVTVRSGSSAASRARSDESGRFALPAGSEEDRVQLDGDGWILLGTGRRSEEHTSEL